MPRLGMKKGEYNMSKINGINNESATLLLEAMLMECREDFEGGGCGLP